jgi:hypothetical protein
LTFSILSVGLLHRPHRDTVPGTVKDIIKTEWDGIKQVHAIVATHDDKGNVLAKLYRAGVETNETVSVDISTGGGRSRYLHASVMK